MSSVTPFQPALPAEGSFTDAEIAFLEDSPPGIFPENQNSNFGYIIRKRFSDYVQDLIGQQQTIYNEMFVPTALQFLDQWEKQVDLPQNPTNLTLSQRRQVVQARLNKGPFTWARRAAIMDNFIRSSFGAATAFTPDGIPVTAAGIPLFAGVTSSIGAYRIYEDVRNYNYSVWLNSAFTPGPGLTRELTRITPAGISFTIDNSKSDVLAYQYIVMNAYPVGYWRLGSLADTSGNGATLTAWGGAVAGSVAAPGLLVPHGWGGSEGATDFNGTTAFMEAPDSVRLRMANPGLTMEAWIRPDVISGTHNIVRKESEYLMRIQVGALNCYLTNGTTWVLVHNVPGAFVINTTYHVVITWDGVISRAYINGVLVNSVPFQVTPAGATNSLRIGNYIGNAEFFDGKIDEVAIYNYALDAATILDHYNTGRDIATY